MRRSRAAVLHLAIAWCAAFPLVPAAEAQHHGGTHPAVVQRLSGPSFLTSTRSATAQQAFDQGLFLTYAFNHDAAIESFAEAARLDPGFAMAHWGTAVALSANINSPLTAERFQRAAAATRRAESLARNASRRERAYIAAMRSRYEGGSFAEQSGRERAYVRAMTTLSTRYPDDPDAATLHADALMNLTPWRYWSSNGEPAAYTAEILASLERALRVAPDHLGANHYYIHAIEASPYPERGLAAALRIDALKPAAGHLVHMPSHIFWRVGDYEALIKSNERAISEDERITGGLAAAGPAYAGYHAHNWDFLILGHSYRGDFAGARRAADRFTELVRPMVERSPGADHLLTRRMAILLRFGRWHEILTETIPPASQPIARAFAHYARGFALAKLGRVKEAGRQQSAFVAARRNIPAGASVSQSSAAEILDIAAGVLAGRIAAARRDYPAAIRHLIDAVKRQDTLAYDEPPNWYYPVRETLGATYLEAGDANSAEAVFRADLAHHPRNPRSLFGLAESLRAQSRCEEAEMVTKQVAKAWHGSMIRGLEML